MNTLYLFLFVQGCEVKSPGRSSPEQATARTVPDFSYIEAYDPLDAEQSDNFGWAIDGGDINGDGYADGIIGSFLNNDSGSMHIYYGSATGLSSTPEQLVPSDYTKSYPYFGYDLATADLDADGYDEAIVSAFYDSTFNKLAGAVYVYEGTSAGIGDELRIDSPDGSLGYLFGATTTNGGDINDDGYEDLIVTSGRHNDIHVTYLFLGSTTGISTIPDETHDSPRDSQTDFYGTSSSGAGDIDGDGYDDILVGAPSYKTPEAKKDNKDGAIYIYSGASTGLQEPDLILAPSERIWNFGDRVDGGDINGDGYADAIVGAKNSSDIESYGGAAFVYYGSLDGLTSDDHDRLENNDLTSFSGFGTHLSSGDIDGDSYDDILIMGGINGVYIYFGSASGVSMEYTQLHPELTYEPRGFGVSLSIIGDTDGDRYDDFLIGEIGYSSYTGRVHYYHGAPEDVDGDGVGKPYDCDDQDPTVGEGVTSYPDTDGDGYGSEAVTEDLCEARDGWIERSGDCDDSDALVSPEQAEVCGDGIDNSCDGYGTDADDEDDDGLTSGEERTLGTDPCDPDTDGDGISDGEEVAAGTDPLVAEQDPDTAAPQDTAPPDSGDGPGTSPTCGCHSANSSLSALWGLVVLALGGRRWQRR